MFPTPTEQRPQFSLREARHIVRDLFEPKAKVYWTDFLLSIGVAYACLSAFRRMPGLHWGHGLAYVGAVLAFYRAGSFIHELVHLKGKQFVYFRAAWNLLCGIPFLMPSYMYHTHLAHHARKHYGTRDDGEYLPLAVRPLRETLLYLLQPLVIPVLAVFRYLVLTPLACFSPRLRTLIHRRASSLVMDPTYVRPLPSAVEWRLWRRQEACCFLYASVVAGLFLTGVLPWSLMLKTYAIAVGVVYLNAIRTMGAHHFRHRGEELSFTEQLLDSVNYPERPWLTGLWAPIGLRYHALHHLFPSMPYHALDEAHKRLMAQLPADSLYRQTNRSSLPAVVGELVRSAWRHTGMRSADRSPTAGAAA